MFSFISRLFFFDNYSDNDFFDGDSDNDGSGSRLSGTRTFYFLKIPLVVSVDYLHIVESLESFI